MQKVSSGQYSKMDAIREITAKWPERLTVDQQGPGQTRAGPFFGPRCGETLNEMWIPGRGSRPPSPPEVGYGLYISPLELERLC